MNCPVIHGTVASTAIATCSFTFSTLMYKHTVGDWYIVHVSHVLNTNSVYTLEYIFIYIVREKVRYK